MYSTAAEAKDNHWFSRRHQTNEANVASGETEREKKARKKKEAYDRLAARDLRSNEEQLDVLRARGVTSGREFDRLTKGA